MQLLIAVTEDLWSFLVQSLFGDRKNKQAYELKETAFSMQPPTRPLELKGTAEQNTFHSVESKLANASVPQKNTVMYVSSTHTPLRSEPTILRDTIVDTLPYGAMVMVLEVKDGWSRVLKGTNEGWVETEDLADRAAHVLPQFVQGQPNEHSDASTERLRAIINDEFSCGSAGLPLQSHEYVTYKLSRKDTDINWPKTRPRTPGKWAEILADAKGVSLQIHPVSGAIMEYFTKDNIGRLAYVEAVFPDGSVQVSEVNWPENGMYNERVLPRDEWSELNPVFIVIQKNNGV